MTVKAIRPSWIYTCDACGREKQLPHETSRPSGWGRLILEQGAVDYQGAEVADASIRRLLCPSCKSALGTVINNWQKERQSQ